MTRVPKNERGAVLLTTLLVMAIMAALAVALMDDIRLAIKRASNVSDYAQADWYVRGAEDYVGDVVAQNLANIENDSAMNQIIATINPIILPIEGGVMQLTVRDGSHCFNLAGLTRSDNGAISNDNAQIFAHTLEALGLPPRDVDIIEAKLFDWIDADNQTRPGGGEDGAYLRRTPQILPPNTNLASVMEIRALEGMTPELYEAIRPWVCMGEAYGDAQFNINLAESWQAPLLAGFMGGAEYLSAALRLIEERPSEGYSDETFKEAQAVKDFLSNDRESFSQDQFFQQIIFRPETLWVELELTYRQAQRSRSFYFTDIDQNPPRLAYRGWGHESFRPDIRPLDEIDASANSNRAQ